jgi:hypothetical protein
MINSKQHKESQHFTESQLRQHNREYERHIITEKKGLLLQRASKPDNINEKDKNGHFVSSAGLPQPRSPG